MAFYDTVWYCNAGDQATTGYYAVAKRPQNTAVVAGQLVRQFTAPAVGSERCFVCIVAGTTANTTDATWVLTRGAKTTDGTATWQECTGASAVNGDLTNTANWTQAKAIGVPTLGAIIQRNSGASYQICSTAGTLGASEPAFSNTAGATTTEGTTTWTCLGPVGNFTGGQVPHARLASACTATWFAPGNTIYVGDNHAESLATAITIAPALGTGTVNQIICHNHSGSYPPIAGNLMAGATISTTAAVSITIAATGFATLYIYGLGLKAGVGTSTSQANIFLTSLGWTYCDRCSFRLENTAAAGVSTIQILGPANAPCVLTWNNTTVFFGNSSNRIGPAYGVFNWKNTGPVLETGSAVPLNFIITSYVTTTTSATIILEAIDLSQISGSIIAANIQNAPGQNLIKDCKLHASATIPAMGYSEYVVQFVRSDSGATAYKSSRYAAEATETTETSITRVGGAADPAGQAQSRKIVTTANAQWLRPFKAEPYAIWNPTTGSNVTVTVCGTINAGALPNNDDIWLEVEYLGSSATPLGTIVTTTKASVLAANAAVASDSSTWNGGGSGAGWSPFKLAVTLSSPQPGLAGYIHARVRVGKASATYYVDPKITLT
jgi:hypothetical protein